MDTKALIGALGIGPGTVAQLPFAVARDSASPGRTEFPVVADPEDTRVNQAWLGFGPIDARAGRQHIKLDSDRFDLFYSYVGHVNRIAGVTKFWAMLSVALP